MRYWIGLIFVLLFTSSAFGQGDFDDYFGASFVGVQDAKTIIFELPNYPPIIGQNIRVRIPGIAVPELKGKCKKERNLAKKAQALLKSVLNNSDEIELKNMNRGVSFLIVAKVVADGQSLDDLLIEKGYAVKISKKKKSPDWCK
ncbi:MAG: thermonuclease family protein [Nitrospinota bacterium]